MKKNIFGLLILFIGWLPGFTQEKSVTEILEESKAKLERISDFSADFTYSIEIKTNPTRISKNGKFHYAKGKFVVIMEDQEIYSDGKSLWIHLPGEENSEVTIMNYDPEESFNFDLIFSPMHETATKSIYEGKKSVNGVTYDQVYLQFSNPVLDYHQVRLWINETSKIQEKVVLVNKKQTITTYAYTNIKTDLGLPESTFVFDTDNFQEDIYDER